MFVGAGAGVGRGRVPAITGRTPEVGPSGVMRKRHPTTVWTKCE